MRVLVIPCTLYSSLVCLAKHLMGTDTGIGLLSADSGFFDGNIRVSCRIGSKPFLWWILKTCEKARYRNVIEQLCISRVRFGAHLVYNFPGAYHPVPTTTTGGRHRVTVTVLPQPETGEKTRTRLRRRSSQSLFSSSEVNSEGTVCGQFSTSV